MRSDGFGGHVFVNWVNVIAEREFGPGRSPPIRFETSRGSGRARRTPDALSARVSSRLSEMNETALGSSSIRLLQQAAASSGHPARHRVGGGREPEGRTPYSKVWCLSSSSRARRGRRGARDRTYCRVAGVDADGGGGGAGEPKRPLAPEIEWEGAEALEGRCRPRRRRAASRHVHCLLAALSTAR